MGTAELLIGLLPFALIGLGYTIGRLVELRHLRVLARREAAVRHVVLTDLKYIPEKQTVTAASLVMGEAVIATDYFKSFATQLRLLVGGELKSMQTLVDRARREAIVRMMEQADHMGAGEIHNVRLETSNIRSAQGNSKALSVEMLAFGTAIVRGT